MNREQILRLRETVSPHADFGGRGEWELRIAFIQRPNPQSAVRGPSFRVRDDRGTICFCEDPADLLELIRLEAAGYGYARELIVEGRFPPEPPKEGALTLEDLGL